MCVKLVVYKCQELILEGFGQEGVNKSSVFFIKVIHVATWLYKCPTSPIRLGETCNRIFCTLTKVNPTQCHLIC